MKNWMKIVLCVLVLGILCGYFYYDATSLATKRLKVRYEMVNSTKIDESLNGLTIAFFSDLDYGLFTDEQRMEKLVSTINKQNPDILVFLGNLYAFDTYTKKKEEVTSLLYQLKAPYGKFAIVGVNDQENDEKMEATRETYLNSGFELIDNKLHPLHYGDMGQINLISLNTSYSLSPFEEYDDSFYTIVVSHTPDIIDLLNDYIFDLMLSGYSLGGQIYLPIIGTVNSYTYASKYYRGKHSINHATLDITNGIGTLNEDVRLFSDPEIVIYRFYSK